MYFNDFNGDHRESAPGRQESDRENIDIILSGAEDRGYSSGNNFSLLRLLEELFGGRGRRGVRAPGFLFLGWVWK